MGESNLTRLERLFLWMFVPFAAASWSAILLAELGRFAIGTGLLATALASFIAWRCLRNETRERLAERTPGSRREHAGLLVALAVALLLFAQPGEYLIEGADASVYLATGRLIQQTGGLRPADPLLNGVSRHTRDELLVRAPQPPHALSRFPGGIDVSEDGRTLASAFFHLLPAWLAIVSSVGGAHAPYYANVAFALLSVLTAWLIGRRLWCGEAATVAALLLATNFAQIWYARIPSSEMLAQWLLLAAIFCSMAAASSRSRLAAACGGAAVGLAGFTRIDALIVIVPLAAAWLLLTWRRRLLGDAWRWYAATLVLFAGHAVLHAATFGSAYSLRLARDAGSAIAAHLGSRAALVGVTAVVLVAVLAWVIARLPRRIRFAGPCTVILTMAALVSPAVVFSAGLLFTPVGAIAVGAAFVTALWREDREGLLLLTVPFACEAVLWLGWREKTIWPDDFRRFVPAVLPLGMLLVAGFTHRVATTGRIARRAAWLLPAIVIGLSIKQALPILLSPPMQGVQAQVATLASQLPPRAILLTDRSVPGHLSMALQTSFGIDGLRLMERASADAMRRLVDEASGAGRPVFVAQSAETAGDPRCLRGGDYGGLRFVRTGGGELRFVSLVPSSAGFPSQLRTANLDVRFYRVQQREPGSVSLPVTIDIGGEDFEAAGAGLYPSEAMPSATARWTNGDGRVRLPAVEARESIVLSIRMAMTRPSGVELPPMELRLDELPLGTVTGPSLGFQVHRFTVAGPALHRLRAAGGVLSLRSPTFVPRAMGVSQDERVLGVAVDWIRLEAGALHPPPRIHGERPDARRIGQSE